MSKEHEIPKNCITLSQKILGTIQYLFHTMILILGLQLPHQLGQEAGTLAKAVGPRVHDHITGWTAAQLHISCKPQTTSDLAKLTCLP